MSRIARVVGSCSPGVDGNDTATILFEALAGRLGVAAAPDLPVLPPPPPLKEPHQTHAG